MQEYKELARNRVIQALITVFVQISIGLLIKNETGLLVGFIVGQIVSVVLLLKMFIFRKEKSIAMPDTRQFVSISKEYKDLLFYSTPSYFINMLINQVPVFLLNKFGGVSLVGSYNFTQRILGLPQQFLSSALVQVFMQKASESYNQVGNAFSLFKKTAVSLSLIAILPFGILALFAPVLFEFFFGANWREAGVIAQYLCLSYFIGFIVSPLTYMYTIARKFKEDLILHLFFLAGIFGVFYIGNLYLDEKKYLIFTYSLCYSFFYLIYFVRSYQLSKGGL